MLRRTACLLLLLVTLLPATTARACPNCAASLPGSADRDAAAPGALGAPAPQAGAADGFYYSILLMLAMPYTLAAAGGYAIYRTVKRHRLAVGGTPASPTAI